MIPPWSSLTHEDREIVRTTMAFLERRLQERPSIAWALKLGPTQQNEKIAISELLDHPGRRIVEPWLSAWRLIEEQWKSQLASRHSDFAAVGIKKRIRSGERSGSLIDSIVNMVRPTLEVEARDEDRPLSVPARAKPHTVQDLVRGRLTSGRLVKPYQLALGDVAERDFLMELALALEGALQRGLEVARRIGWNGGRWWLIGELRRVYFADRLLRSEPESALGRDDPDDFHEGIAPCAKLLHATVYFLGIHSPHDAALFADRWAAAKSPIHIRLWAALARDKRFASGARAGAVLLELNNKQFWNIHSYPEISEARARRFFDMPREFQVAILKRIRRGPPRSFWQSARDPADIDAGRLHWILRELRRIEIAGGILPNNIHAWVEAELDRFPDIRKLDRVDSDFLEGVKVYSAIPDPDKSFDSLNGLDRLDRLEAALQTTSSGRRSEDPAQRVADWLRLPGRTLLILPSLVTAPDGGAAYPQLWNRFGWTHAPRSDAAESNEQSRDVIVEARQVLSALMLLPTDTESTAIEGISDWLFSWAQIIANEPDTPRIFLKLWPIAVGILEKEHAERATKTASLAPGDSETIEINTLNSPVGKLTELFIQRFAAQVAARKEPFSDEGLRVMRETIEQTSDQAAIIATYRLIEHVAFFLSHSPDWTAKYLLPILKRDSEESLAIWVAASRGRLTPAFLSRMTSEICDRILDERLIRDARKKLLTEVLVDSFFSVLEHVSPAIPHHQVQQVIRTLDDDIRASGADDIKRLVEAASAKSAPSPKSTEEVFTKGVAPFFKAVWPQEKSLTTPSVARALADLPASCGDAFEECAALTKPYLVPFECWSLYDIGIDTDAGSKKGFSLEQISSAQKARALLDLLDAVVGTAEGAVVPFDLGLALDRILKVAPKLASSSAYQRLFTQAR